MSTETQMYANEYAITRGHSYNLICKLCQSGILPAERNGRKYRIYFKEADEVMNKRKYTVKYTPKQRQQAERQAQQKRDKNNGVQSKTTMTPEIFLKNLKKAR